MADTPKPKPPPSKVEKTLWELPGVFKVGLVSEEQPAQPAMQHVPSNVTMPVALVALAILCVMFLVLGGRKRRSAGKP